MEETEPNKWQTGKIYQLTCGETGKVYIGSTIASLEQRLLIHLNKKHNSCVSRHLIKPVIELIETFPCKTGEELLWRERYYFDKVDCVNKKAPIRTDEERKQISYNAYTAYRLRNRDKLNAKQRMKFNCECGGKYTRVNKQQHLRTQTHSTYLSTLLSNTN